MQQRRKEAEESGEAAKMSRRKLRLSLQPSMVELKAVRILKNVFKNFKKVADYLIHLKSRNRALAKKAENFWFWKREMS